MGLSHHNFSIEPTDGWLYMCKSYSEVYVTKGGSTLGLGASSPIFSD